MTPRDRMTASFPFVREMGERALGQLLSATVPKSLESGQVLAREGDECGYLPFITEGTLRVYKIGEQGKELTLYRVEQGESCILTATCILNSSDFPAVAQAEGATEVLLMPANLFVRLIDEYPVWRHYLFSLYSKRLDVVLSLVQEVAFHHVDTRIVAFLVENGRSGTIQATHQQIASEIGTSREVVSRILKDLEAEGLITTSRGLITIDDAGALHRRSEI